MFVCKNIGKDKETATYFVNNIFLPIFIAEITADTGPLITHLTTGYDKLVRPVILESQAVNVAHEIVPVNVIAFVSTSYITT